MTQAASLTCMMEGNGDKTDNMYVFFFQNLTRLTAQ